MSWWRDAFGDNMATMSTTAVKQNLDDWYDSMRYVQAAGQAIGQSQAQQVASAMMQGSSAGSLTIDSLKQAKQQLEAMSTTAWTDSQTSWGKFWESQWCTNDDTCTNCFESSPDINRTIDSIIKDYKKATKNHGEVKGRVRFIHSLRPVERVRFNAWVACEEQIAKEYGSTEKKD